MSRPPRRRLPPAATTSDATSPLRGPPRSTAASTGVDTVAYVETFLAKSFRAWCANSEFVMMSQPFHPVFAVDDEGVQRSFQVCEAHVRACFPDVYTLLDRVGAFKTLPVPNKALSAWSQDYTAMCVNIYRKARLDTPEAATDFDTAYMAYVMSHVVDQCDVTSILDDMVTAVTWWSLFSCAQLFRMTDLVVLLEASRYNYHELLQLRAVFETRLLQQQVAAVCTRCTIY